MPVRPQDRSDGARRSCDVEVLGAAPDPGGRDLRHARKRRALARSVGDAVGRCRREVARTCGDARHGVPPRPPRVSTCRRLARGRGGLLQRIRPRRGHRGHVRIPPHACGRSGGVPARDVLARGPGRAPPGQAGGQGRLPPCWPARPLAVLADEKYYPLSGKDQRRKADGTRPRGLSRNQICIAIGCDGKGRSHSSRLGLGKPGEPGTRAAYAGHIQRGSHLTRDMERSHKVLVREPGLTEEAHDPRRTRTLPDKEDPPHGASELCYLPGLFPSSHPGFDRARSGGVSRPVPRDDEPSRREDGESCLRARPRNAFPIYVEIPRVLPKEDQLKGNSVLLGTHNQQRRIFKKFFWPARGPAELRRGGYWFVPRSGVE